MKLVKFILYGWLVQAIRRRAIRLDTEKRARRAEYNAQVPGSFVQRSYGSCCDRCRNFCFRFCDRCCPDCCGPKSAGPQMARMR